LYEIAKEKKSARCGSWDMSFKLLAMPPPTVRKACKSVDFEMLLILLILILLIFLDFPWFWICRKNTQNSHFGA